MASRSRLKKSEKLNVKNLVVSDIEASDWINFLCIGIYDGKTYRYFTDLKSYFEYIYLCKVKEIYFHFGGGYDFLFLIDYAFNNYLDYDVCEMIPRGSKFLSISIKNKKTDHTIKLLDSSALLPFSLKSLAQNFGVETQKGEIDYEKITSVTDELLTYMKGDHFALHQVLEKFFKNPLIIKAGRRSTIASQAYAIFKKIYLNQKITRLDGKIDTFCRQAYLGGRTEIFSPVFDGPGKLNVYDVNSLFPYVMRENDYPIAFKSKIRFFDEKSLSIYHCRVRVPMMDIPPLGVKHKGKFIFPVGEFDGYWTNIELSMAKKFGVKILEVYDGVSFQNGGKIFKDYVNDIYTLRKNAPSNSADNMIYKLLLNSLYGRFALNLDREKIVVDSGKTGLRPMMSIKLKDGKHVNLAYEATELKSDTFPPISIFVTSYSRVYNYENYLSKYKVYYHDTDSFFMKENLPISNELGGLKLEYTLDQACFLLPKTYFTKSSEKSIIKMKGFDKKKISKFSFDDFLNALEGDMRRLKSRTPRRIAKFRESIRRNKKVLSILEESEKSIKSKYDKRIFYKKRNKYYSKPIFINNDE